MNKLKCLAPILALALAGCATPQVSTGQQSFAKYDRPYSGKLSIHRLDRFELEKACGRSRVMGCAMRDAHQCHVFISNLDNWIVRSTLRHEIAHCNGWPANHGNPS